MSQPNLESLRWTEIDLSPVSINDHHTLELYRNEVIRPALELLDQKIDAAGRSEDAGHEFLKIAFEDAHALTVEGFLLTVQAMFERGLRRLVTIGAHQRGDDEKSVRSIRSARWNEACPKGIQQRFAGVFDAPMNLFGCYADLDFLQVLGNALRHGDGPAAERLHDRCPSLWINWLPPGAAVPELGDDFRVPDDAPRHPSFDNISLSENLLRHMVMSVLGFWEDIEFVRCNSFRNIHPSTDRYLDELRRQRSERASQRLWNPH